MTSRISFWTSLVEDLKRRNWLVAITALVMFFVYPVRLAVVFNGIKSTWEKGYQSTEFLSFAQQIEYEFARSMVLDPQIGFIVLGIAFVCSIQGFAYLYKKQKVDLFYSVPVSKGKRFATVYLNGILIFTFALLVNFLLSILVGFAYGAVTVPAIGMAFLTFGFMILLYLAFYNITLIAVMMTGNLVVTCLAAAVFFLYEAFIRILIYMLGTGFFESYYSGTSNNGLEDLITSPFIIMFNLANKVSVGYAEVMGYLPGSLGANIAHLIILILVTGFLAYYLHGKRPAEASERAMAFTKSKMIIKILISVPLSMLAGLLFYFMTGENSWFLLFGLVIGVVLCHCVFEVIYEFDMKAVLKHKRQLILSSVLTGALFSIFYFDLTGYDSYIPKADKIESIALAWNSGGNGDTYNMKQTNHEDWVSRTDRQLENMKITEIEEVLELAEIGMNNYKKEGESKKSSERNATFWIPIKYTLQNGKEKYRTISVDIEETLEILESIYQTQEYKIATYQFLDNEAMDKVNTEKVTMLYMDKDQSAIIKDSNMKEFLDIYQEEFMNYSYDNILNELPTGRIIIEELVNFEYPHTRVWNMPIYKEFTKTIAYMEERDLYEMETLNIQSILSVEIINSNSELVKQRDNVSDKEMDRETMMGTTVARVDLVNNYDVIHEYTQVRDIEEMLPYLYRFDLIWSNIAKENWFEADYSILVSQLGNNENDYYYNGGTKNFQFLKGQVPEFVKEDTTYVERD